MSNQHMLDTTPSQNLLVFCVQAYIRERNFWSKFQLLTPYGSGDMDTRS